MTRDLKPHSIKRLRELSANFLLVYVSYRYLKTVVSIGLSLLASPISAMAQTSTAQPSTAQPSTAKPSTVQLVQATSPILRPKLTAAGVPSGTGQSNESTSDNQGDASSADQQEIVPNAPRSLDTLSFEAVDTAKRLGLWDSLSQFDSLRRAKAAGRPVGTDYLEARQNLMESLMVVSQEARTFVHFIEQEVAKADSINALLAARRDRALKLNTYGDLISGGITGVVGGGLEIADINHLSYDTLDTVEGAVQTGLALLSLREQRGDKRIEKGIPNILARLFDESKGPSSAYPASVWAFLNAPAGKNADSQTRRQKLVADWTKSGFCLSHHDRGHGKQLAERQARITNNSQEGYRITSDLIEDRTAMLHELRSTVTRLDVIMLELLLFMKTNMVASTGSGS